jgi:hypothetical protein
MHIDIFENQLEGLIGRPTELRPFVCDGSPLDCTVFIVGVNATTNLDFWAYWVRHAGYDKSSWEQAYYQERSAKGKRGLSNTRTMLGWVLENLPGVRVLETNVYAKASAQAADLAECDRDTSVFRFLLHTIQPKVILVHGDEAQHAIRPLLGLDQTATVLTTKHLRFWSRTRALDLSEQIKRALAS